MNVVDLLKIKKIGDTLYIVIHKIKKEVEISSQKGVI